MTMPLAAAFLCSFRRRSALHRVWVAGVAVLFITLSMRAVFWSNEGLLQLADSYRADLRVRDAVVSATPTNAIVMMNAPDRAIFPSREVMMITGDTQETVTLGSLRTQRVPVWFLNESGDASIPNELRVVWRQAGFIPRVRSTFTGITLYQLVPLQ